jgi:hypothetical protein
MQEFLLIGQRPTNKINNAAVGVDDCKFYNRLSNQFREETLVYPRDEEHETFFGAVTQENNHLIISVNDNEPVDFKKDFPNLLFFSHALEHDTLRFMQKTPGGGEKDVIIYHAITSERGIEILRLKEINYDGNETLWQHYSPLRQHLFIQEIEAGYVNGYKVIIQRLNKLPEPENIVWVNPVCLRLPLAGDELNKKTFQLWEKDVEPLWIEPLFQSEQAPRIQFYQRGEEKINSQKSSLSRIEKLIWGNPTNDYHRWQAFAALDALQGHFHLDNSQYSWQAPKRLSANARYFADYWLKRWHGKEDNITHNDNQIISPPSYTQTFRYATNTIDIPFNSDYHSREKLFRMFSLSEQSVFKMIEAILTTCPDDHPANELHRGYLTIHENQAGNFNANAYLYEFARRYIVPFSLLTVAFPQSTFTDELKETDFFTAQKKYYKCDINKLNERFALTHSTFHGARGFFQQLCECLENGSQDDNFESPLQVGWWNHWHEWLYTHSTASKFIFSLPPVQQPTRVGQAKVGKNTFVGGRTLYRQDKTMCF